ncbi:MAG: hypothetical protein IPN67_07315 [Bacteroidales bacterium]|nr:hypothetical protein [Bacteroidales bacterium]
MDKQKKNRKTFSRRDFVHHSVKGAIGVALLPTILPSCSGAKVPMTGLQLRISE